MASDWRAQVRKWSFVMVPAVALFELLGHVVQVKSVVGEESWARAAEEARARTTPNDLLVFAPRWTDPIGRKVFGDTLATLEREAWADVSRFPRAIEVSIRGEHAPELSDWKRVDTKSVDAITLTTLENPSYVPTITDLVGLLDPGHAEVSVGPAGAASDSGARPCSFLRGAPQSGNLGFGSGIPAERFACPGTFVATSVIADLDYHPRRCIYAPPPGGGQAVRIVFRGVTFGDSLHGHHGLYVEAERSGVGSAVHLAFSVGEGHIGKISHADGDGWKGFDLPTSEWAGKTADLTAEVTSANGNRRMYCFEAVTR